MNDFDRFFDDNYARVVRTLVLAGADRARAEDAAQEAFTKAIRKWRRVGELANPAGWVYVVAVREVWRRSRALLVDDTTLAGQHDPARDLDGAVDLRAAIGRLPTRQKLAVVLRFYGDLSVSEVADAMGCAEGTVKSTLNAAVASLRGGLALQGSADE